MENLFNPKWWDKWLRKNLKKKARLFPKKVKKPLPSDFRLINLFTADLMENQTPHPRGFLQLLPGPSLKMEIGHILYDRWS